VVTRRKPGQLIIGFAAETENRMENGRAKLLRKGADAIVINDVSGDGVGIDSDLNAATFLTTSTAIEMPEMTKRKLADRILDETLTLRRPRSLIVEGEGLSTQDQVLQQSLSPAPRRPIIME
jgi:phosphopantothenoylcysteine decarboxylase / phosphopantothenate---cysteine ligase